MCLQIHTDFHSQVTTNVLAKCTPKNVLSKCMVKLFSQVSSLLTSSHSGQGSHCGTVLFLWCSRPALVSLTLPPYNEFCAQNAHCGLCLLVVQYLLRYCNMHVLRDRVWVALYTFLSFCGSSSCSTELVLANRRHLLK